VSRPAAIGILLVVLLLTGCRTSAVQEAPIPDQAVRIEKPNHCRIYLFRKDEAYCGINTLQIHDRGFWIGGIGRRDYLCWERPAGPAEIKLVMVKLGRTNLVTTEAMECRAGEVYYWMVELSGTPKLPTITPMSEDAARVILESREQSDPF
jgi:hypothetical protein